jgi:hypothetical protein
MRVVHACDCDPVAALMQELFAPDINELLLLHVSLVQVSAGVLPEHWFSLLADSFSLPQAPGSRGANGCGTLVDGSRVCRCKNVISVDNAEDID